MGFKRERRTFKRQRKDVDDSDKETTITIRMFCDLDPLLLLVLSEERAVLADAGAWAFQRSQVICLIRAT
jgi:hypothetical protein